MINRKITREISVGDIRIGNGNPIAIQSMTTTDTRDVVSTVDQIKRLENAGCDIVRLAVPDRESALAIKKIKDLVGIPLVADIHFDYRLALEALDSGVDKLRINPGNIGDNQRVRLVVEKAKERNIPIRIGVNSGSVDKELLEKYKNKIDAEVLVESAAKHIEILESMNFKDIAVSIKASDVLLTVASYRLFSERYDYPTHIGITEAGTVMRGTVKSSAGLGIILYHGIGDTMRVSLTSDPVEEIKVAREILKSVGLYTKPDIEFVSCPTCGRCKIDLIELANALENECAGLHKNIKVAVMGCAVNGPGEARDADIGIAGGDKKVLLFKKGEIIRSIDEKDALKELVREIKEMQGD
ncbi:MAG: flavodoxin-dependent (E)-4-hydroxy-3-methylbut-2-enyl-diphosphate synthase [Eubacteriaceae bacterium]|nr:flavodoxin-dependent (E)-4-hydroxy-3-methylbut-2-enyl-diphosphate synthase [Eubacteriaceae bacterium]